MWKSNSQAQKKYNYIRISNKKITFMKRSLIFIIAVLSILSVHAQKKSLLDYPEISLGVYADGKPVLCRFVPADPELKYFVFTPDLPLLLVSDEHAYHMFNTETCEELSEGKFKGKELAQITMDGILVYSPDNLFSFHYGRPTFLNLKGEKVWTNKDVLAFASRTLNVSLCLDKKKDDQINAYDLSTGKLLWHKVITDKKHSLWADEYKDKSDKRIRYFIGDSLIRLNVVTGDTLRHAFTAGVKEPLKSRLSLVKLRTTLPGRGFTREAIYSYSGFDATLKGTHSNIIFSGDSMFVADANHLYCLDKELKTRWMADLPSGCGSFSAIKIFGNEIRMQNYGVAFQNSLVGRCGHPFSASFDRKTGRRTSLDMIGIKSKVIGGMMVDGRTYWQTDNHIYYNDNGDSIFHEIKWKLNTELHPQENYPDYVICDTVGVVRDGVMEYVTTDSNRIVVEVYGQDVNVVKSDGSCEFIPADKVFIADGNNVYSTNNIGDKPNTFVIVDPKTRKVECTFHLRGSVTRDTKGNVYVATKQGVGFHKFKPLAQL